MTHLVFEPSHTTHWKNLFPSKMLLLGSQNLNPGEELIAQIKSVGEQDIKDSNGKVEQVSVVEFEQAPPMVLNITNARTIANLYGDSYTAWIGRSVQIYATEVRAFGAGMVQALRIRAAIPDTSENVDVYEDELRACASIQALQKSFMSIPNHLRQKGSALIATKDEMKGKLDAKG